MTARARILAAHLICATAACGEPNASSLGRFGRQANFPMYYLVSGNTAASGAIYRVDEVPGGETATSELVVDGLTEARSLAEDQAGNLFVTETLPAPEGSLKKIVAGTNSVRSIIVDLVYPTGVAVDSFSQIYILENGRSRVVRLGAHGRLETLVEDGIGSPEVGAIDLHDNLYISEAASTTVSQIRPDGGLGELTSDLVGTINAIAVDSTGQIHVLLVDVATQTGRIVRIVNGGNSVEIAADLISPTAIAFDGSNALYIAEGEPANRISRIVQGESTRRAIVETQGEPVAITFTP